jgi:hypothetical protein
MDDGRAVGYAIGTHEEQRKRSDKVAALTLFCLIELVFIALILARLI